MPRYEYRCPNGHVIERNLPFAEYEAEIRCDCGATAGRVFQVPMVPVLGAFDRTHRMRRRPDAGERTVSDISKIRRPVRE